MPKQNPDYTLHFAGTRAFDAPDMPDWYETDDPNPRTFGEAFRSLITADTSDVAWKVNTETVVDTETLSEETPDGVEFFRNEAGDVWATTTQHNAVWSPDLLNRLANGESEEEALLNIPTDSYALVNPQEFYRPLEAALEDLDLGQHTFGEFRVYDRGAEVHGDIWFDTKEVDLPDDDGYFKFGIQTGYDFKGNRALYANIIAQDTSCTNTLRELAEKKTRRHVSESGNAGMSASEYQGWWGELLEKVDLVADELNHMIQDAAEIRVAFDQDVDGSRDDRLDVIQFPFDMDEFYRLAGVAQAHQQIPAYLRKAAANDASQRAGHNDLTMWDLHSGLTYALTHVYRGGERGNLLQYNQVAKDMVYNPQQIIESVAGAFAQEQQEADDADGGESQGRDEAVAMVAETTETLSDRRKEFENRQERVRTMLQAESE